MVRSRTLVVRCVWELWIGVAVGCSGERVVG